MMKRYLLILALMFAATLTTYAQTGRSVSGTVIDSTKLSVPGASVKLTSAEGDSSVIAADMNGKFTFPSVKGTKINVTVTSIGYQVLLKHYSLEAGTEPVSLGNIVIQVQNNQLNQVNIVGAPNPVTLKEDTVEYKISTYKVRDNAPVEDAIRKMPGVDVDKDGNVTAQGKSVTRVRVNGKDFFAGDLKTATQNLPADIVESVQIIDDYGDQANLTGVKTGEPNKILNINIRKDKNYGYSLQATAGEGTDALPSNEANNANRYLGNVNYFKFKGDQQIAVLGNLNNTNLNTFSFSGATGGGFGGNFNGGGRGGGGGRGNALRGGGGSTTTNANGITDAKSLGLNFRDQWGKNVSVYGSYSFNDNSTYTTTNSLQINRFQNPSTSSSSSQETNNPLNHRFNFNVEWKPDTINYFKITPSFSYSRTNTVGSENVIYTLADSSRASANQAYSVNSLTNTTSPNYGINALYNHKFGKRGRNFSLNLSWNTAKNDQFDNPIYNYTAGTPTTPLNQRINTNSRTTTWGANFAYMEPLSKVSFLELNYAYNHSNTSSDKLTDTLSYTGTTPPTEYSDGDFNRYALLSNSYDYTFTTNRVGLNYRLVESKYNLTAGFGVQPASLKGNSVNAPQTVKNTFNFIPTARFVYNFSRSKSINFNYNGQANQPSFNQLQPVLDLSNALYPVLGNPDLKPSFTNTLEARYNNFSFETGNVFFTRFAYTTTMDQVVSQTTTYGRFSEATLAADPSLKNLQNTNLTTYRNADGYYQLSGFSVFSKPFAERKYTLFLNGNVTYSNNIGYSNSVDSLNRASEFEKNISKNLVLTPGVRFRVNIDDVMDAEVNSSYAINRTVSAIGNNPLLNTNARTLNLGVNGKNYFWKDWTLSYDFTRSINYGYNVAVTNPNILNVYVERRFLKDNVATIRLSGLDLLNQNRGFTSTDNGTITTQSNVNRLSRYVLLTFSLRLRKFAGGAPSQGGQRDYRRGEGGGPGAGGPPPGGGPM